MTTAPQGTAARRLDSSPQREDKGNLYGIVVMQITMLFFVTTDTLSKLVSDELATGQLIFVRGMFAVVAILVILIWRGELRHYRHAFNKIVLLRAVCETVAAILFLTALKHLPLANTAAILLTIPLATTAAAALFLGEQVGIRRWTAVFVGFLGVMAIVRPGLDGFNSYSLFALAAVVGASTRDLVTRRIPSGTSLWVVTLTTLFISAIGGGLLGVTETWQPVSNQNLIILFAAAFFLTMGQFAVVIAMNSGEISVVSSFRYISMPIALTYGYLLWGDIPDTLTWVGICLILSAGIYTIFRERKVSRLRKQAQQDASISK
ncbi:DMT family transporter [Cohaesibacter celericrescens]|uniref:EamA family transporter n=1 Tax=Cohaesibacter celericrescens TaxID=2067669 RepID=A0A2N5XQH9_9HYPH|nr:DMT family transporter [Cohaesibacter celericrescens]PLW76771.1 EamA family transporter [Cohaesibacter celericrescens]